MRLEMISSVVFPKPKMGRLIPAWDMMTSPFHSSRSLRSRSLRVINLGSLVNDKNTLCSVGLDEMITIKGGKSQMDFMINFESIGVNEWLDPRTAGDSLLSRRPKAMKDVIDVNLDRKMGFTKKSLQTTETELLIDAIDYDAFWNEMNSNDPIFLDDTRDLCATGLLNDIRRALTFGGADQRVTLNGSGLYLLIRKTSFSHQVNKLLNKKVQEFAKEFASRLADSLVPGLGMGVDVAEEVVSIYRTRNVIHESIEFLGSSFSDVLEDWSSKNEKRFQKGIDKFVQDFGEVIADRCVRLHESSHVTDRDCVQWQGITIDGRGNALPIAKVPVSVFLSTTPMTDEMAELKFVSVQLVPEGVPETNLRSIGNQLALYIRYMNSMEEAPDKDRKIDSLDFLFSHISDDLIDMLMT
eukprot:GHVH01004256.1.p1 GENE.GHVH01004256.1~~GHVH01004256.1.p1  ORF type:complete len:411 (+),score=66.17 GHVH01004256.1:702-1934(+)